MTIFSDLENFLSQNSFISKRQLNALAKAGINTLGDLISIVPVEYEFRNTPLSLDRIADFKEHVLLSITVLSHDYAFLKRKGRLLKILFEDSKKNQGELHCYGRDFIKKMLPVNSSATIWAKFGIPKNRRGRFFSSQFEIINDAQRMQSIVPRYRSPPPFSQVAFFKLIRELLHRTELHDLHPYRDYYPNKNLSRSENVKLLHFPETMEDIEVAKKQFAFDEVLLFQLAQEITAQEKKKPRSEKRTNTIELVSAFTDSLPFSLTKDQIQVINEIQIDLLGDYPMRRLLQGDVGSGKTLVALICALAIIENKEQVVLIAPSETLANQHYKRIQNLLLSLFMTNPAYPIECCLITGSTPPKQREKMLKKIKNNEIQLIIGTHAVYSADLEYARLGFIIIDEQHRFGVEQRTLLLQKGRDADLLLMSATPIPRTLALTVYSSLDISTLTERPGLKNTTSCKIIDFANRENIYPYILKILEKGEQAFFVFPQIGIDEEQGQKEAFFLSSIFTMHEEIQQKLHPYPTALLHSKVNSNEQAEIMDKFERKELSALLCTTIIEVGIDIHNATLMCIFNAERFGLATLHQLRGRVGRGSLPGQVILVYNSPLSDIAKERLKVIYTCNNGFEIAEKDLELRGPGDVDQLGTRQSGTILFHFHNSQSDSELLFHSQSLAKKIALEDPHLKKKEHVHLKKILKNYYGVV